MVRINLVVFAVLTIVVVTSAKKKPADSADQYLVKCVSEYAQGFVSPKYKNWDDLKLHCFLDSKLAKCVAKYIKKAGADPTFFCLAKASASYVVFEEKVKVCRVYKAKSLLKKMDKVKMPRRVKKDWSRKIDLLLHPGKVPKCAQTLDMKCVTEYAQRMRQNPDLCKHIPFKTQCLRRGYTTFCKAQIVQDILNVFPYEADQVLAKLCQQK